MKAVTSGILPPEAVKSPNVRVVTLHMTNIMIKSLKSEMDFEICFTKKKKNFQYAAKTNGGVNPSALASFFN